MSLLREIMSALVFLVAHVAETGQFSGVPSAHFGTFDFAELESAAYEVKITNTPVSELHLQENTKGEADVMYMSVLSKHGQLYRCSLPVTMTEDKKDEEEEEEEQRFLSKTLPNVSNLLKPLSEQECLIKTVGWWTYEYCHGKFVRQYHLEAGRLVGETKYLGFYERETEWDENHINRVKGLLKSFKDNMVGSMTQAYHSIYYVNGTECDITQHPRSARVQLYCTLEGIDKIVEIDEKSTCNYTLTVQSPLLCQHPLLAPLGNSAASHTLSCAPVVSQLDYEDHLLKQELIRQQKEKLSELQRSDDKIDDEKESPGSLTSVENQLLRKLVMSSITQLAQIASESLYDSGYLEERHGMELDLDEIDDDDEEVGAGGLKRDSNSDSGRSEEEQPHLWERETERQEKAESRDDIEESSHHSNDHKVSDKIKKMSSNVKSIGKDKALESLLNNLAVTAEYIESLEDTEATKKDRDNEVSEEISDRFETGEPGEREKSQQEGGKVEDTADDGMTVRGPSVDTGHNGRTGLLERAEGDGTRRFNKDGTSNGITALSEGESEVGEMGEQEEEKVDAEMVKEIEHQLEESLAQQLDTDAVDVKVKIVTIPEDQLREALEGEGEESVSGRPSDGDLSAAMSKLLDSLLNDEEPMSEDRQKQSDLETSYDQVWGDREKEKGESGR